MACNWIRNVIWMRPSGATDWFVAQYLLMPSYFSVARARMVGLAGKYKSNFGAEHVVRTIQTNSRTMELRKISRAVAGNLGG
jgi:hypothetical protein